jgi:hypothetical protein
MWRPTQQDGLWFHRGNLHQSRHYSLYLALQLKARAEGTDTPVFGLQEVHHLRSGRDAFGPAGAGGDQLTTQLALGGALAGKALTRPLAIKWVRATYPGE